MECEQIFTGCSGHNSLFLFLALSLSAAPSCKTTHACGLTPDRVANDIYIYIQIQLCIYIYTYAKRTFIAHPPKPLRCPRCSWLDQAQPCASFSGSSAVTAVAKRRAAMKSYTDICPLLGHIVGKGSWRNFQNIFRAHPSDQVGAAELRKLARDLARNFTRVCPKFCPKVHPKCLPKFVPKFAPLVSKLVCKGFGIPDMCPPNSTSISRPTSADFPNQGPGPFLQHAPNEMNSFARGKTSRTARICLQAHSPRPAECASRLWQLE